MTTDPIESTMELGHQIVKLMATLTRAGQGNIPTSTPNSPRQRGHGRESQTGALLATPAPRMAKLVWDRPPQSAAHLSDVAQGPPLVETRERTPKGLEKAPSTGRTPAPSSASGARVGVICLGNVLPQPKL